MAKKFKAPVKVRVDTVVKPKPVVKKKPIVVPVAVAEPIVASGIRMRKCCVCREMKGSRERYPMAGGDTICRECYSKLS